MLALCTSLEDTLNPPQHYPFSMFKTVLAFFFLDSSVFVESKLYLPILADPKNFWQYYELV